MKSVLIPGEVPASHLAAQAYRRFASAACRESR